MVKPKLFLYFSEINENEAMPVIDGVIREVVKFTFLENSIAIHFYLNLAHSLPHRFISVLCDFKGNKVMEIKKFMFSSQKSPIYPVI